MITAIFDAGYMARRAYFSMGRGRSFENSTTFGFFRDVAAVMEQLNAEQAAFCFDSMSSERRRIFPNYKISRNRRHEKMTPAEKDDELQFHIETGNLPTLLRTIGYQNVFHQNGYEADDLIAECVRGFPGRLILVSSDHDLWQLLCPRVSCWNPQKRQLTSERSFMRSFGVEPERWIEIKAIAGCSSDDIPGVDRVGEKTAARYLRGELAKTSMPHERIRAAGKTTALNRTLVRLPFPGTQSCAPMPDDNPTAAGWARVADITGIPLIAGLASGARRKRVKK